MSILRFQRVTKDYFSDEAAVPALRDINLEFSTGQFAALIGRSGCGKSTLLNLAGAMDLPTSGDVMIDGQSTTGLSDAAVTRLRRISVGFIFQSFQLLPALTVLENVELPMQLGKRPGARKAALDRLEWVDMAAYASRMPYQLSGGQMQRVAIARALVHSPKILLADEPTGNLDTATGDMIVSLLRRIATETSTTILMATHSAEAAALTDVVVQMRDGQVVELRETCPR